MGLMSYNLTVVVRSIGLMVIYQQVIVLFELMYLSQELGFWIIGLELIFK